MSPHNFVHLETNYDFALFVDFQNVFQLFLLRERRFLFISCLAPLWTIHKLISTLNIPIDVSQTVRFLILMPLAGVGDSYLPWNIRFFVFLQGAFSCFHRAGTLVPGKWKRLFHPARQALSQRSCL